MKNFTLFLLIMAATSMNAQIINVHPDSTYTTIQAGINAANPGDTVLVADGTYYEQIIIQSKMPLLVASHFIMDNDSSHLTGTIIDGSNLVSPNQSVVIFNYVDSTAVLAGFTIQHGRGTFGGSRLHSGGISISNSGAKIIHNRIINNILDGDSANCNVAGAAIAAFSPSWNWIVISDNLIKDNICISSTDYAFGAAGYIRNDLRFHNNVVTGNQCISSGSARSEGAGICADGTTSYTINFIATSNKIYNNLSQSEIYADGAGMLTVRAENTISNNQFIENESKSPNSTGAGIELGLCPATSVIENNLVQGNKANMGAGLDIWQNTDDNVFVKNNTFIGNTGNSGSAVFAQNGTLSFTNNVFNNNNATQKGGAIYLYNNSAGVNNARIINNSFSGNDADMSGGAIFSMNVNPYLLNNIFWGNTSTAGEDIAITDGTAFVAFCNIDTTKIMGEVNLFDGIIFQDPSFCDTIPLKPNSDSPCLNAGAEYFVFGDETVYAPTYDINYGIRPLEDAYDMGAYEVVANPATGDVSRIKLSVFPNPSKRISNCQYTLENESKVSLSLYNMLGVMLYSHESTQETGNHIMPLDLSGLNNGIYLLRLTVNGTVATRKIVKEGLK